MNWILDRQTLVWAVEPAGACVLVLIPHSCGLGGTWKTPAWQIPTDKRAFVEVQVFRNLE